MRILAVFDIDGVLVNSKEAVYEAYNSVMHLKREDFNTLVWNNPWKTASSSLGLLESDAWEIHQKKNRVFPKYAHLIHPDPLALSFLRGFLSSPSVDIVLATGGSKESTAVKLRMLPREVMHLRVLHQVTKRSLGFWRGLKKDYPGRLLLAIDDDISSVETARKEGIGFVWTR